MNLFILKIMIMQPENPQPNHLLQPQQKPLNKHTLESSAVKQTQGQKPPQRLTFTVEDPKGKNTDLPQVLSSTSHPIIGGLHILIKIGVVFIYLTLPFITSTFNILAAVVVAAAIDFWFVKNISGRFLVGLKWWIDFSEDGDQQWRFQCKVNQKDSTLSDQRTFWWTLTIFSLIWVVFSIINVLKFDIVQITICVFSFSLLFFNLHSFYRCSNVQKQNVNRLFSIYGGKKAAQFISGSIISCFR